MMRWKRHASEDEGEGEGGEVGRCDDAGERRGEWLMRGRRRV